ncbi:MAG: nucleotidyltransferase domain-containing protein [Eubacteriales bacterium]
MVISVKMEIIMDIKDDIYVELVEEILKIIPKQVVRIVLYGSQAKGLNTNESDVDIALLLNEVLDRNKEDQLSEVVVTMNLKYDKVFSVIDIDYNMYLTWKEVSPFYRNVKEEGIILWEIA